jgi:hypothetical protein
LEVGTSENSRCNRESVLEVWRKPPFEFVGGSGSFPVIPRFGKGVAVANVGVTGFGSRWYRVFKLGG